MFTQEEISLMRKIGLDLDFDNLSDNDWCEIEDVIGDYLTLKCLDKDYNPSEEGLVCESILDKLP